MTSITHKHRSDLKALNDGILFQFEETVNNKGEFVRNNTASGIILHSTVEDSAKSARWATVVSAGPDCKVLKAGDRILLPALRWTTHITHEGQKLWKSDEKQVAFKASGTDLLPLNDHVAFVPAPAEKIDSTLGGLIVVTGSPSSTPSGVVVWSMPDHELKRGDKFYYVDPNFNGNFVFSNKNIAFIKQSDIMIVKTTD